MPPSLFLTEGFVPEELLEEEKKRTQTVLDEGIRTLRDRGFAATGHLAVGEPVEEICRPGEERSASTWWCSATTRTRRSPRAGGRARSGHRSSTTRPAAS
jgi:hypothetical protein